MQELIPPNFKLSQFESYDGTSDPVDHLEAFRTMMLLHGAPDTILCRAFPSTLKGAARNWYSTLKSGTIFSFDQMSHQFVAHFVSSRCPRKGSEFLMNIRQREGESIRAYINRFNVAVLEVWNLDQSVAMAALKGGLQKNDLLFSLEKKYPRDFADLLARAEGYVRAEEAFKMKDEETARERQAGDSSKPAVGKRSREAQPRSRSPPGHKRAHTLPRVRRQRSLNHGVRRGSPPGRFCNYAPLNASKTQVPMEVREQLPRPERMRTHLGKRNLNKFCLYHHDHGHDMEECIQL
ncbi:PREDICTED: uncharacterized protein LOC106819047 [Priapulus caudatus]|uniref:Uncharacterized protein LOC106819047 n=1 Tax=Priapulus caudatus TaxID=37621 RepID=A0ABM1F423_PRICU|nr:PREDICTED: uncharacterized protein LOC106819047 [Priapulus caudatus]